MWINNLEWSNLKRRLKVSFLKPQAFISFFFFFWFSPLDCGWLTGISLEFSPLAEEAFWFNGIH